MVRRGFTIIAIVSGVLCLAATFLWVRSYVAADTLTWTRLHRSIVAGSVRGRIWLTWSHSEYPYEAPFGFERWTTPPDQIEGPDDGNWRFAGFEYQNSETTVGNFNFRDSSKLFVIPCWFLTLLTAVPPLLWLYRRRRRYPTGRCRSCGYDLRATPDRCPECGVSP